MSSILDKVPPHSLEAEMAVLGCMMIEKEALETALELLEDNSFYKEGHQKIFATIRSLSLSDKVVDTVTLVEELRVQKQLQDIGGTEYIANLINIVSTAAHVEAYCEIVRQKQTLRKLIRSATQVVEQCYQETNDTADVLDQAEKLIYDVSDQQARSGLQPVGKMMHEIVEDLESLHQRKEHVTGIASGLKRFDELTTGFQPGNLIILAARPGAGKTALALSFLSNIALKQKKPVAFFSLEMSQKELIMRVLSSVAEIPLQKLRTGFFGKSDWPNITRKAELLAEAPIYLDYSSSAVSIMTLRSAARRLALQLRAKGTPLAVIMIDYLQLMQGSRRNPESRQTEIAEISRSLKALARDLEVPIIALSQLNRSTEERGRDGRPQLSDLRESGAIEQDADLVGFIFREGMYKKKTEGMTQEEYDEMMRRAKLIIAKQRNGPLDDVDMVFVKECARFDNLETDIV